MNSSRLVMFQIQAPSPVTNSFFLSFMHTRVFKSSKFSVSYFLTVWLSSVLAKTKLAVIWSNRWKWFGGCVDRSMNIQQIEGEGPVTGAWSLVNGRVNAKKDCCLNEHLRKPDWYFGNKLLKPPGSERDATGWASRWLLKSKEDL